MAFLSIIGMQPIGTWSVAPPGTSAMQYGERAAPAPKARARAVELEELPDPRPQAVPDDDYSDFANYAAAQVTAGPSAYHSAVIAPETVAIIPAPTSCAGKSPAVVIDLDIGDRPFDVNDPPLPLTGLAHSLGQVRRAGITVLWITAAPPAAKKRLKIILAATGLDENGDDQILVTANNDRKQTTRLAAARNWCIVAIAGDQMSDFEEAYDFLKDPNGPTGSILRLNINNGWFLKQAPIQ